MSNEKFGKESSLAKLHQLTLKFREKNTAFERNIQGRVSQIDKRPSSSSNKQSRSFRFNSTPLKKQSKVQIQSPDELEKVSEINSSRQVSNRGVEKENKLNFEARYSDINLVEE